MPMDIEKLSSCGPSPFFAMKLLLGSIEADIDRPSKRKDSSLELYGEAYHQVTQEEMDECHCQKKQVDDQSTKHHP